MRPSIQSRQVVGERGQVGVDRFAALRLPSRSTSASSASPFVLYPSKPLLPAPAGLVAAVVDDDAPGLAALAHVTSHSSLPRLVGTALRALVPAGRRGWRTWLFSLSAFFRCRVCASATSASEGFGIILMKAILARPVGPPITAGAGRERKRSHPAPSTASFRRARRAASSRGRRERCSAGANCRTMRLSAPRRAMPEFPGLVLVSRRGRSAARLRHGA